MKKLFSITLIALLYCSPAAAQKGPANILEALLGPTGPVQGLARSLQAGNLQPLVDGIVSDTGLVQGGIAAPLNRTLSGLLVQGDAGQVINSLGATVVATTQAVGQGVLAGKGLQLVVGPGGLVDLSYGSGQVIGLGLQSNSLALPGLQGGAGFSASQMQQLDGLLGR